VALSVAFKTFPILLLPVFLININNKFKFIARGILVALLTFFPFMTSLYDFNLMLRGAIFVHGERGIQGRPILSFLTYNLQSYGFSFYQAEYSNFYTYAALFGSMLITSFLILRRKQQNILVLSAISFFIYMLFTPVLNRTHIIWFIPFFILGLYELLKDKKQIVFIGTLVTIYFVIGLYSYIWLKGLKQDENLYGKIWSDEAEYVYEPNPNIGTRIYNKIFHIMNWERYPGMVP
ncbi:MAG: hypothetical protein KC414_14280, partial [Romboutsia sp.]|nr:hypothetical protein [Romboutsia sp.]